MIDTLKTIPSKTVIDSIKTFETRIILDTLRLPSNQSLDLITKVDTFYNNAWTKLIGTVTILFAIVGIIVPLIIQWYQKKESDKREIALQKMIEESEKRLKAEIKLEYEVSLQELIKQNDEKLNQLLVENKKTAKKLFQDSKNLSLIIGLNLEAIISEIKGDFNSATFKFVKVFDLSLNYNSENNQKVILKQIKNSLLKTKKKSFDSFLSKKNISFIDLIKPISAKINNEEYHEAITDILETYNQLPE